MPHTEVTPMVCMYAVQTVPAPAPPNLASQTVIQCQPMKVVTPAALILFTGEEGS